MARWVRRRDRAGRVLAVASQSRGVLERYGISRDEADRAAWTVDHDGHRLQAAAAINRVLEELGWRTLPALYRLRPVAAVEEALYGWFARSRSRFRRLGVKPECEEVDSDCA